MVRFEFDDAAGRPFALHPGWTVLRPERFVVGEPLAAFAMRLGEVIDELPERFEDNRRSFEDLVPFKPRSTVPSSSR